MRRKDNMTYGYFVGQEEESLGYFEARLRTASDPEEKKDLEIVVRNVRRAVEVRGPAATPPQQTWSQSFELSGRRWAVGPCGSKEAVFGDRLVGGGWRRGGG